MSYTTEDLFDDHILEKLMQMMLIIESIHNEESDYDIFMRYMRDILHTHARYDTVCRFRGDILRAVLGDVAEEGLHRQLEELFNLIVVWSNKKLKKVVYVDRSDEVTVEYDKEITE